jgi:hypothetical protein
MLWARMGAAAAPEQAAGAPTVGSAAGPEPGPRHKPGRQQAQEPVQELGQEPGPVAVTAPPAKAAP